MPAPTDETFTESQGLSAPLAAPQAYLFVVLEGERPRAGSSRHCLSGVTEMVVGRGPDRAATREGARLALTFPSGWLSTAHLRLCLQNGRWHLEDLGSRNGTWVNGKGVAHLALSDGDVIEAGRAFMLFRDALHGPATPVLDLDTRTASFPAPGLATLIPALAGEIDALVHIGGSPIPVLLRGETGTGKEVAARALHARSKRAGAFVPVNCGAIPQALVESHLFGHVRGAFSGATRDELGFARAADGGTLFLDEIGDLPSASQAALLRVLQDGVVTPVGSTRAVKADLRVISATHRPLEALVARGAFRADLFARLDGFTFVLPPLRERREDTGLLVDGLLQAVSPAEGQQLAPEVGRALLRYDWPLNVRELGHCLARACALARGEPRLELRHLPPQLRGQPEEPPGADGRADANEERLRAQLEGLLVQHDGNIAEVARSVGKARMQVHRWLKRFAIDPTRYRR